VNNKHEYLGDSKSIKFGEEIRIICSAQNYCKDTEMFGNMSFPKSLEVQNRAI
jgi:hypothetical protein